jgi:hypothetical protein
MQYVVLSAEQIGKSDRGNKTTLALAFCETGINPNSETVNPMVKNRGFI